MKKIIITAFMTLVLGMNSSFAGITNSEWFDPVLGCTIAGGVAYSVSTENQAIIAGLSCGVTALVVYLMEERGRSIQKSAYDEEMNDMRNVIREHEIQKAQAAANGEDETYSIKVRRVVPGYTDSKGRVIAPTIEERLVLPGEGMNVGD